MTKFAFITEYGTHYYSAYYYDYAFMMFRKDYPTAFLYMSYAV